MVRTRTRLTREQRRAQLIDLGVQVVGRSSFDDVSIDDVAAAAGISRSLLFHYFPTRRDFLVAVAEASAEELLAATDTDPSLRPGERLRQGLERYLDYVGSRREAYLSLVRGATGGDPALQEVFDRTRQRNAERVLEGLGFAWASAPPLVRLAVRSWVAFVEEASVSWLAGDGEVARDDVVTLAEQALSDLLERTADLTVP